MVEFGNADVEIPGGSTTLTRMEDTISIETNATRLVAGDAVTAWWVVFNNPEFCAGSCAGSDLSNPEVEGSIMYADGAVIGEDGKATFIASLNEGDVSGVDTAHAGLPGAGIGLADASKSEVHIVMRTHGAALSEGDPQRAEQLTTFNGGCNTECSNVQAAAFSSLNPILLGDANDDGRFDQLDIAHVLQSGKYRTSEPATFSEGDWNADGMFDQLDVVAALRTARYASNPNAALVEATAVDALMVDE